MRTLLIVFVCSLWPVTSLAQDDASTTQGPGALTGTWAQKVVNSSISDVPIVGEVSTDSIGYLIVDIQQHGSELRMSSRVCDLHIVSSVSKVRTVVPRSFIDAIDEDVRSARVHQDAGTWRFTAPKRVTTLGVRLRNREYETLPSEPDDPRVLDPDRDGHPGMTLRIEGVISGELYVVQRAWDVMNGVVRHGRFIDGLIDWGNDQALLDSTSIFLGDQPPSRPHPDASRSYFRSTKVDQDTSCRDVVAHKKKLFRR